MLELNKVHQGDCIELMKDCPIPDLIIADPPYDFESSGGAGIVGMRVTFDRIAEDKLDKFDFDKHIIPLLNLQRERVNSYFFCNKKLLPKYLNAAVNRGLLFDVLTMNKKAPIPTKNSSYLPEIEYIVFIRSPKTFWNGKLDYSLYFKSFFCYTNGIAGEHPTEKPILLIKKFIQVSSKESDLILDPFLGSGTTAVACIQLGRKWIGIEKEPKYVELANKRIAIAKAQSNLKRFFE